MDIVEHLRDLKLHNAADEIERLREQLAAAQAEADQANDAWDKLDKLDKELAACQRDAERYRWLRESNDGYLSVGGIEYYSDEYPNLCDFTELRFANLDAAIDAAMGEK